ncbi:hypothetical protein BDQ17DRAFT_1547204 [Cyathus striatus]|nr:hypothetical protein BDQ17DRAFT_1547204 [Cyathus striatus]
MVELENILLEKEHFPPSIDDLIEEHEPSKMMCHGLVPDDTSSPDKISQIIDHWVLGSQETSTLIKVGKVHGVSVTSLVSAVLSLAACEMNPAPASEKSYEKIHSSIDLLSCGETGTQKGQTEHPVKVVSGRDTLEEGEEGNSREDCEGEKQGACEGEN